VAIMAGTATKIEDHGGVGGQVSSRYGSIMPTAEHSSALALLADAVQRCIVAIGQRQRSLQGLTLGTHSMGKTV